MHVFTSDYLEKLRRRWATRPENDWPLIARIALLDERADDRERIERFVGQIDGADRPKISRNLQSEKQFITTYGELWIGHLFVNAGVTPRYEPELRTANGVCTPDWYINGCSPIVCDVFTAGLQQQRDADETALRDIEARLATIRAAYMIRIEVVNAGDIDPRGRKEFVDEVERWLASGPSKGDMITIGSATVEVLLLGGNRLDVLTSEPMHIVETPAKLSENFEEKTKKYKSLGLPLIAAAVKHHRAEIGTKDVEDVLFGRLAYVSKQTETGKIVGGTERLPGGVFSSRPELSAAVWLNPYRFPDPVLRVWRNPTPLKAAPEDVLERLAAAL